LLTLLVKKQAACQMVFFQRRIAGKRRRSVVSGIENRSEHPAGPPSETAGWMITSAAGQRVPDG
jgi:hypothetical protein